MSQFAPALVLYAGNAGYVASMPFNPDQLLSHPQLWEDFTRRVRLMIEKHKESLEVLPSNRSRS